MLQAFDLPWEWPENFGTLCASRGVATQFCERAESEGYSQDLCSYVRNNIGYVSRALEVGHIPPEAPPGGMGTATMLLGSGTLCDPRIKWFQSLSSQYLPLPVFHIDPMSPPHDVDVDDPRIEAHYKEILLPVGDLSQSQDLRADGEVAAFCGFQAYLQVDLIRFRQKPDHAAVFDESFGVADREDVPAFQTGEDIPHPLDFGPADEEDLTTLHVLDAAVALNDQWMSANFFTAHGLIQEGIEWVIAQDADPERLIDPGESGMRPLDELGEVKKENSLDLVFLGNSLFGPKRPSACGEQDK